MISSPYKRAIQTVEGIAKYIDQDIVIEKDFRERELSGKPVEDFNYAIAKVWEDFNFSWEGGESNKTAQKRGLAVTQKVLAAYKGKNIAIGTHGNLMALIMNFFDEKYDFNFWKELDMPDVYKLSFDGEVLLECE